MHLRTRVAAVAAVAALAALTAVPTGASAASTGAAWHFRTQPKLRPPELSVTTNAHRLGSSWIFTTPFKDADVASPEVGQPGALIVDTSGDPVWFQAAPGSDEDEDLQPQTYEGKPALTFWQGVLATSSGANASGLPAGTPEPGAGYEILSQRYRVLRRIFAQDGWTADYHEFLLTSQGDALYLVARTVKANLTAEGGAANGAYEDGGVQALDLATGKVLYTWDMADHVALTQSAVPAPKSGVWDPYHLNSISVAPDGSLVISARNTWSVYDIAPSAAGGPINWTLDAKPNATDSSFTLGPDAGFAWQHDAQLQPDGDLTLFDDHCCALGEKLPTPAPSARGEVLNLNASARTATLVHSYPHAPALLVPTQGSMQTLPDGDLFLDWGQQPLISAYTATGQLIYAASLPAADSTYRAYLLPWVGLPATKPAISVTRTGADATVYASWNGATRVTAWELLAGAGRRLKALGKVTRAGFETAIRVQDASTLKFQVEGLDARGAVLAASATASSRPASAHAAAATVVQTDKVKSFGSVLAGSSGHVLYLFDADTKNHSSCSAACQKVWKPYLTSGGVTAKAGSGLNAKLLGTIKLKGGRVQATYAGHPLYEYTKDRKAGQVNGQALYEFGGDWYLVGPKGKAITCQPGLICGY